MIERLKLIFTLLGIFIMSVFIYIFYIIVCLFFLLFFIFIPDKDFYNMFNKFYRGMSKEDKDEL